MRERTEHGAVIPLVAVSLVLIVVTAALAVDLGRVAVLGRALRTVVDLAALDAARVLDDGDTASQQATVEAAATASAARNGFSPGPGRTLVVTLGTWDATARTFTPTGPAEVPDAVEVAATEDQDNLFAPGGFSPTRRAVAIRTPAAVAALRVGSATAVDDGRAALVDALAADALDAPVAVGAAGWATVGGTTVTLGDLVAAAGGDPGDPGDLAAYLDPVRPVADVVAHLATALAPSPAAAVLAGLPPAGPGAATVRLADLVIVGPTATDAADAPLDALGLLTDVLLTASGGPVSFDPAGAPGPGVVGVTATLTVEAPPTIGIGPAGTSARAAQVVVLLDVELDPIADDAVRVPLVLRSGPATATLDGVDCAATGATAIDVSATSAPALVVIGTESGGVPAAAPVVEVVEAGVGVGTVLVVSQATLAAASSGTTLSAPFGPAPTVLGAAPTDLGATVVGARTTSVAPPGPPPPPVLDALAALDVALPGVAAPLLDTLIPAVLDDLGAAPGTAGVAALAAWCRTSPVALAS